MKNKKDSLIYIYIHTHIYIYIEREREKIFLFLMKNKINKEFKSPNLDISNSRIYIHTKQNKNREIQTENDRIIMTMSD